MAYSKSVASMVAKTSTENITKLPVESDSLPTFVRKTSYLTEDRRTVSAYSY